MTRNSRLLLVGGGALVVTIGAGLVGSMFAQPNPGPAASAAQTAPGILGDAVLTELLGGAGPELVHRCSEGARVVRNRGDDRGSDAATRPRCCPTARCSWPGAGSARTKMVQLERPRPSCMTRAAGPGARQGACTRAAPSRPRRCCKTAGCWWLEAAAPSAAHRKRPNCMTRSAEPGLSPRTNSWAGKVGPPRCFQMARCSLWAATTARNEPCCTTRSAGPGRSPGGTRHKSLLRHGHAAFRWQAARGGRTTRPPNEGRLGRAVRPEQRVVDRHWGHEGAPHRSHGHAAGRWQGARSGRLQCRPRTKRHWSRPNCTTRSAGPGRPPGTWSRPGEAVTR